MPKKAVDKTDFTYNLTRSMSLISRPRKRSPTEMNFSAESVTKNLCVPDSRECLSNGPSARTDYSALPVSTAESMMVMQSITSSMTSFRRG